MNVVLSVQVFLMCAAYLVVGHHDTFIKKRGIFGTGLPQNSNNSIQYLLYTPQNPSVACYFEPLQSNDCPFNKSVETKILIHGYKIRLLPGNVYEQIKDTLLSYKSYNVIIVNWTKYDKPPYLEAVTNSYLVADKVGEMINFLISNKGANSQDVHIIGHSLGAQVAGNAGKHVRNLGRVTGLDPAAPFFIKLISINRLTKDSANFVDVIHTSNFYTGVGDGVVLPIGSIDFYPNGGNKQPGCYKGAQFQEPDGNIINIETQDDLKSCYHCIALFYFKNSINQCDYLSVECSNYEMYSEGRCDSNSHPTDRMGLHATEITNLPAESTFYLNTSSKPPYC